METNMSAELNLKANEFEEKVLKSTVPVLIDFWAEWCGPCRIIAPIVEEMAKDYTGKLTVYKVDVDAEGALAARFGIMSIPTLLLFKDGKEADRMVGAGSKPNLVQFVERHLK